MSFAKIGQRWKDVVADTRAQAPFIAARMAQTGLTLIKERSIRDGISVDGALAAYTPNEVYKSGMKSRALNSAGKAYAASGGKGNWQGLRGAQGMKTDSVNLFYTGRMWTAIRPVAHLQVGYRYTVLVAASDAETFRILLANIKRYGNFMRLTEQEEQVMRQDAIEDVADIIKKHIR